MQAAGRYADDGVAALHRLLAIQHLRFLHHAHDRAADVVFAGVIKARHLGGLTADERATVFRAGTGETLDDFGEHVRLQLAGAQIIEKKQWLSTEHGDVVDTMVDEVGADGVVLVHREGNFEFGADAVHGRHEHRFAVFFQVQRKQTAEAADLAEHLAPVRRGQHLWQGGFDLVAQINVHAGRGISLLFHHGH